jgi:hypothetical protein
VFTARYGLIPYIKQVYITVVESVYSAVRTDFLHKKDFVSFLKGLLLESLFVRRGEIAY